MIKMVCAECGGENVMRDAWAEWDAQSQSWTLQTTFDAAHCDDCDGECSIDEEPADDVAPEPDSYLSKFTPDQRETAARAYADGFADGANDSES